MAQRILFFDVKEDDKKFFEEYNLACWEQIYYEDSLTNYSELPQADHEAEIISVFTTSRVGEDVLSKFPYLKLIAARSVGLNHIDMDYCREHNITVKNAPHYGDNTVAEFTFGLMLDVSRHITKAYYDLKSENIHIEEYCGTELFNKTLGIIGLGAIGGEVARIARGFHMNILAYDIVECEAHKEKHHVKYTTLDDIAQNADIVTIHMPSTKTNYHLIGADFFNKMKSTSYLINTARGEIVDTQALYDAISSKKILGAGLDVLEYEEMISSPDEYITKINDLDAEILRKTLLNNKLLKLPNVIITPHIAFNTKEAIRRTLEITLNNIYAFVGHSRKS